MFPRAFRRWTSETLCELDYPALAAAVIREYLTDYSPEFLAQAARTTYGEAFGGKAGYLAPVEGDTYALEPVARPDLRLQGLRPAADAEAAGGGKEKS